MDNNVIIQALLLLPGISRKTVWKFLNSVTNIEKDPISLYDQLFCFSRKFKFTKQVLIDCINHAESIISKAMDKDIDAISILDDLFPPNFKLIDDPPVLIYVKGNILPFIDAKNVAIIGTREPTEHGSKVAHKMGAQFAKKECGIVSGLALGCDAFGHKGCLEVNGKAAAILPGGVDIIKPASNKDLAEDIIEKGGVIISEYKPGTIPFRGNYVERNRLQSALSEAVVVVETDIHGGTMHTVNFSIAQNKILACYKHPDRYLSEKKAQGTAMLIKEKIAIPIDNEESIIQIVKLVENKLILRKKINNESNLPKEEQMTFI